VRPYMALGLARIADTPHDFVAACEASLAQRPEAHVTQADAFLSRQSWDSTWRRMERLLERAVERNRRRHSGQRLLPAFEGEEREVG
jgi:hypothetical protein